MDYLVLLDGMPRHGKTHSAAKLGEAGFTNVSLDAEYVAFIQSKYPRLHFPDLGSFIAPHFNEIVVPGHRPPIAKYQAIMNDWEQWVAEKIAAAATESVVCEGYLLNPRDYRPPLSCQLHSHFSPKARVRLVTARKVGSDFSLHESGATVSIDDLVHRR